MERRTVFRCAALLAIAVAAFAASERMTAPSATALAQGGMAPGESEKPYVVDYYYKAKWGHADEFLALFKKNHYPLLKKQIELGRILRVKMVTPRYHSTEDGRWDFRVTILFKDAATANDDFDSSRILKELYPDQETFKKEEQRRFEILDAHWDVPLKDVPLDGK